MEEHLLWIASRAAGIAALLLSSAPSASASRWTGAWSRVGARLRAAHEALSLTTLIAIVVHAVALLDDSYLERERADIAIPFESGYKEPWSRSASCPVALIAPRRLLLPPHQIGVARWKMPARWTAPAWLAGIVHSLGEGTDAGFAWRLVCTAVGGPRAGPLCRPPPPVHPRPLRLMSPTLLAAGRGRPDPPHRHRREVGVSSRCSRRSTSRWPGARTPRSARSRPRGHRRGDSRRRTTSSLRSSTRRRFVVRRFVVLGQMTTAQS